MTSVTRFLATYEIVDHRGQTFDQDILSPRLLDPALLPLKASKYPASQLLKETYTIDLAADPTWQLWEKNIRYLLGPTGPHGGDPHFNVYIILTLVTSTLSIN